ncbi:NAD(P)H-binding protein [Gemella bergeri]|uniref:NAD(P)H-binding protein n=1 Tax=Gemella bergeri TaxID=84136 RepID=UPI00316AE6F4
MKHGHSVSYLSRTANNTELPWICANIFSGNTLNLKNYNFDIAIHLIGTIKNKNQYSKINTLSVKKSIELCKKSNIKKLVFISAQGGFKSYLNSKLEAEKLIINSGLDYLIVKPGLMYGKNRLSSYLNVIPIKIFSTLGIKFFKNVYPLPVETIARKIVSNLELNCTFLTLDNLKN